MTLLVKWVDLKQFFHDGIATGGALVWDSALEVPEEHKPHTTAPAGPNSGWTMLAHVNAAKPGISRGVLGSRCALSPVARSLVGGRLAAYGARGWRESLCSIARFNSSGISCEW